MFRSVLPFIEICLISRIRIISETRNLQLNFFCSFFEIKLVIQFNNDLVDPLKLVSGSWASSSLNVFASQFS